MNIKLFLIQILAFIALMYFFFLSKDEESKLRLTFGVSAVTFVSVLGKENRRFR